MAVLVASLGIAPAAVAKPTAPALFCATYPTSPACRTGAVACTTCHVRSEAPPTWNPYGEALRAALGGSELDAGAFAAALPGALAATAAEDADADGTSNEDEIYAGTLPGDAASFPREPSCPEDPSRYDYRICQVDYRYLLRKVSIDFCRASPTLAEVEAVAGAGEGAAALIDDKLDACLASEAWRGKDGVLDRLAHRKIRPIASVKSGDGEGVIPLADYDDDYALFAYTQIDDHDARAVLLADYFVERTGGQGGEPTRYEKVEQRGGQLLPAARRAGMISSAWFLVTNVMFTALPRTAAAQAYRAYLGYDIARQEGLFPIDGEPYDYDGKGVAEPTCAACHSTLDPLAYPFRNYNGLSAGGRGAYVERRIEKHFADEAADIVDIPEAGALLGERVDDLAEWVAIAAESDDFANATVMDYWQLAFGAPPTPEQSEAFIGLSESLKDGDYSVARMLHQLVRTEAYGAP